jgi:hypothetical protein
MEKDDFNEEISPITEPTFSEMLKLKENVFTPEVQEKLEEFVSISNMDTVARINKKIIDLIKEELKTGLPKTDSISIFMGLYICFLSYFDSLQEIT